MRFTANNWAERQLALLKAEPQSKTHTYLFLTSCVETSSQETNDMRDQAEEVTYEEMASACDLTGFKKVFGYGPEADDACELENDLHVSYWRSSYRGCPCYYLSHSSIEYIWVDQYAWVPEVIRILGESGAT